MQDIKHRNEQLEKNMVDNAKTRLESLIADDGNEHSLQFSMLIKSVFEATYDYIKENKPPFFVSYQQSAYVFAQHIISCIYTPRPIRDVIHSHTNSLMSDLGWEIELPKDEFLDRSSKIQESINRIHTRMLSFMCTLPEMHEVVSEAGANKIDIGVGDKVNTKLINELRFNLHKIISCEEAITEIDGGYIQSIMQPMKEYLEILEYSVGVMDESVILYNMSPSTLYKKSTLTRDLQRLRSDLNFVRDGELLSQIIKDDWMVTYVNGLLKSDYISKIVEIAKSEDEEFSGSVLYGTENTRNDMAKYIDEMSKVRPKMRPLLLKPKEWKVYNDSEGVCKMSGGMHHFNLPLVPTLNTKMGHLYPERSYLDGVNRIQQTGYRINTRILDAVSDMGYEIALGKSDFEGLEEDAKRSKIASTKAKNVDMGIILSIAEEYRNEQSMYFVQYSDFRGRVYYRQEYLSPQGQDLSKALLEFDRGYILATKKSVFWMKVNLANLGGQDKLSLKERVKWVTKHTREIRTMVERPRRKSKLFVNADKPYQFLAACMDYVDWLDNPDTHKSCLPNGMDGCCNGLQHWCAMLRDLEGGSKVALVNTELPTDIYSDVLNELMGLIKEIRLGNNEHKRPSKTESIIYDIKIMDKWYSLNEDSGGSILARKFTKTPTMTSTYSAGAKAFKQFVHGYCKSKGVRFSKDKKKNVAHINEMVKAIIHAIETTVCAQAGMNFVKECVKDVDEVHFMTPIGFHMYMRPKVNYKREFTMYVSGRPKKVTFSYEGNKTNDRAMQTGIAPNFIHSMDATHMLMVVMDCPEISHWMMIHDQFSCHHVNVERMQQSIRKCFVDMYNNNQEHGKVCDQLARFKETVGGNDIKLPPYGKLNVPDVLHSQYFFC